MGAFYSSMGLKKVSGECILRGAVRTLPLAAGGLLEPVYGVIRTPRSSLYCPQRTDDPPEGLDALLACCDVAAVRGRNACGTRDERSIVEYATVIYILEPGTGCMR